MNDTLRHILESPAELLLIWAALCLLALLIFALRPRRILLADSETGALRISRHALHKLIETCCEQTKGIAHARARVTGRTGNLSTRIRLKIRPDAKLDAIQNYLAQEVAAIYRNNLGITNEGPVEIEVTGVIPNDHTL